MKIKQNIPNFLTCCNLLCGCLAIVQAFNGDLVWAAYLVGIAAVFDFFDGFAARMLGVSSPIGKDLDSLADMVTFGVVPGIIIYQLIKASEYTIDGPAPEGWTIYPPLSTSPNSSFYWMEYIAFLIPIFSAIRLAKFNNDPRQSDSFIGVPTPANSILICSLPLVLYYIDSTYSGEVVGIDLKIINLIHNLIFLVSLTVIMCFLLVSELPLFALKFKSFGWKGNEIRYVFLGLSLILLIALKFIGIPIVIILYILLSIVNNLLKRRNSLSS